LGKHGLHNFNFTITSDFLEKTWKAALNLKELGPRPFPRDLVSSFLMQRVRIEFRPLFVLFNVLFFFTISELISKSKLREVFFFTNVLMTNFL
jgi:hypothetical protein